MNIPAVGLGSRPPSIISTDEGGFNEPSPEIKAKLKPSYTFDPPEIEQIQCKIESQPQDLESSTASSPLPPLPPPSTISSASQQQQKSPEYNTHSLHYVDFGYRLNPDGSESRQIFGESELYRKNSDSEQLLEQQEIIKSQYRSTTSASNAATNGFAKESTVLYATIKPEIPPPADLFLEYDYDRAAETEKIYHSPQTILDPTRPNLLVDHLINAVSGTSGAEAPPRPPLPEGPPLDLQDVEFADASDKEDYLVEDMMTADEAERLLSSR